MTLNINAQAGDETRANGDFVQLPDPDVEEDGTNAVGAGVPVAYDGSTITPAAINGSGGGDDVVGVLYTYQYFGDSSRNGPFIDTTREPTVMTRGAVVADLSDVAATPAAGDVLGPNGELVVLNDLENGTDLYEVLVR